MRVLGGLLSRVRWTLSRISTVSIGVHLAPDRISAVGIARNGSVRWTYSRSTPVGDTTAGECLRELFHSPQYSAGRTRRVIIGLHSQLAQFKQLWCFPPTAEEGVASAIVRENAARFFRTTPNGLSTSSVRRESSGSAWAAACDSGIVQSLVRECRTRRIRLIAIVPADSIRVSQAAPEVVVNSDAGAAWLCARRAMRRDTVDFDLADVRLALRYRFTLRERLAAIAFLASLASAATLPIVLARRDAHNARSAHEALRSRETAARTVLDQLSAATRELEVVLGGKANRGQMLDILAQLAIALPSGSVILRLEVDSLAVSATVLAPSPRLVIDSLSQRSHFFNPELVGAVTTERVANESLSRFGVRLARVGAYNLGGGR